MARSSGRSSMSLFLQRAVLAALGPCLLHCALGRRVGTRHSIEENVLEDCTDVNTASKRKLKAVNGIGDALADVIVEGRCYRDLDDLELKLDRDDWGNLKRLVEAQPPVLCVKPGSYNECSGESDDEEDHHEGCLDLNGASQSQLRKVNGIGGNLATVITSRRCYRSVEDFEAKIKAIPTNGRSYWGSLRSLMEENPSLFCVPPGSYAECAGGKPEDDSPDSDDEPEEEHGNSSAYMPSASGVLGACDAQLKLPRRRSIGTMPAPANVHQNMRFVVFKVAKKPKITFVPSTPERLRKCLDRFPKTHAQAGLASSSDQRTFRHSVGVCVIVKDESGSETPIEYAEYNTKRNVPNFVAYRVLGKKSEHKSKECRVGWTPVCPHRPKGSVQMSKLESLCDDLVDFPFGPADIKPWNCPMNDRACTAKVDTRGHMAPVNDFNYDLARCSATMNFVNVFPSRNDPVDNPFDGYSWARREQLVSKYFQRVSEEHRPPRWGFVMMGVSKESDGVIPSKRKDYHGNSLEDIEVPSFAWKAVFDPVGMKATGWLCRNGLSDEDDCYCVDELSIRELEARVGYTIFPQLQDWPEVNLEDGRHDAFWSLMDEEDEGED